MVWMCHTDTNYQQQLVRGISVPVSLQPCMFISFPSWSFPVYYPFYCQDSHPGSLGWGSFQHWESLGDPLCFPVSCSLAFHLCFYRSALHDKWHFRLKAVFWKLAWILINSMIRMSYRYYGVRLAFVHSHWVGDLAFKELSVHVLKSNNDKL